MNEIKEVVNANDDNIGDLSNLNTTNKDSIVEAVNEVAYDYIVERGTSDFWQYIKWASGKAECFGNKQFSNVTTNKPTGNNQYYGDEIDVNLPNNLFTNVDFALFSTGQGSLSSTFFPYRFDILSNILAKLSIRSFSNTTSGNCPVTFHIIGTWK